MIALDPACGLTFEDDYFVFGDMSTLFRAAGMRGLAELLAELNQPVEPLMRRFGIPLAALDNDDLRISLVAYAQLLEHVAEATACPDLGLRMAERQDIGILGPLAIAMQNASTMGDALRICIGYMHTHSPAIRLSMHPGVPSSEMMALRLMLVAPSWLPHRQVMEQCLADLLHFIQWLARTPVPLVGVQLPHAPAAAPERYTAVFGRTVDFEAAHAELVLPTEFLQTTLQGASEEMQRLSLEYLQLAFHPDQQTLTEQVTSVLRRTLSTSLGRRDVIARLLETHPRTLQRRLAAEGQRYQDILDSVRREQALQWLTETDEPLAQVAGQLGLADQTVLCRNCRRWFGRSPTQVRQQGAS